jgi:hypothetical protein
VQFLVQSCAVPWCQVILWRYRWLGWCARLQASDDLASDAWQRKKKALLLIIAASRMLNSKYRKNPVAPHGIPIIVVKFRPRQSGQKPIG